MPPPMKTVGATKGALLPSRRNQSWAWMCLPPWARQVVGLSALVMVVIQAVPPVTGHSDGGSCLPVKGQPRVTVRPGCSAPAWMDYLQPSDHFTSPPQFLSSFKCFGFSFSSFWDNVSPMVLQRSPSPPRPVPLQSLWQRLEKNRLEQL